MTLALVFVLGLLLGGSVGLLLAGACGAAGRADAGADAFDELARLRNRVAVLELAGGQVAACLRPRADEVLAGAALAAWDGAVPRPPRDRSKAIPDCPGCGSPLGLTARGLDPWACEYCGSTWSEAELVT